MAFATFQLKETINWNGATSSRRIAMQVRDVMTKYAECVRGVPHEKWTLS
jgi:hypothetical protein